MRTHTPILCALRLFACLAGAAALPSLAVAAAPAATAGGPRATLQRLNDDVDKRLRQKVVAGSAEDTRLKNEVKELASELLDYGELCKRALGEHWDKMPVGQRTDFVATLKELIERNYVKQLKTNLDYQVTYGEESIEGSEAKVTTTVKIATKGKATEALIEYRMIKQPTGPTAGKWMVYDVITDELSLVRNYRTQFQRIISGQGYDGLLTKMKTKLNEERVKDGGKPVDLAPATPIAPAKPAAAPKKPGKAASRPAAKG